MSTCSVISLGDSVTTSVPTSLLLTKSLILSVWFDPNRSLLVLIFMKLYPVRYSAIIFRVRDSRSWFSKTSMEIS